MAPPPELCGGGVRDLLPAANSWCLVDCHLIFPAQRASSAASDSSRNIGHLRGEQWIGGSFLVSNRDTPAEGLSKPDDSQRTDESLRTDVFEGIKTVVLEHLDLADPSVLERNAEELETLSLVEDLQLDSIELLTLAVEVEDHFQVVLDEFGEAEEATGNAGEEVGEGTEAGSDALRADASIGTLGDLVTLICEKLAANRGVSGECLETAGPASR